MTLREFARRMRVNESTVRHAIQSGRLESSVGYEDGRPYIADVPLAKREWQDNRDTAMAR